LALLVTAAFAAMPSHGLHASQTRHLASATQRLQEMNTHLARTVKPEIHAVALQDADSDKLYCYSSVVYWLNISNSSCGVVSQVWEANTTGAALDSVLNTFCVQTDSAGHTCQQKVEYALTQFVTNCSKVPGVINQSQIEDIRSTLTAAVVTCLTDDTNPSHYCIKDFKALTELKGPLNQSSLDSVCTACNKKVFTAFTIFADKDLINSFFYLDLLCFQINGQYCSLKFQEAQETDSNAGPVPTTAQLDALCDPCTVQFVYRLAYFSIAVAGNATAFQEEVNFVEFTQYACVKDFNNNYCYPQIATYNFSSLGAACLPEIASNTCSSDCLNNVTKAKSDLGCCFGTWFNLLDYQYVHNRTAYQLPYSPDQIRTFVAQDCGTTIPLGCTEDRVALALVLSNVDWAWYQANAAQVQQDLKNYLAYLVAVDVAAIETFVITQAVAANQAASTNTNGMSVAFQLQQTSSTPTGILVSATIVPSDSTQAASVASTVQNNATSTNNPIVSTWPLSSRINSSQAITTTSASATTTGNSTNPSHPNNAATVYPSVAFMLVVALLLL